MGKCDEGRARSAVYRLLSTAFLQEPSAPFLESLAASGAFRLLSKLANDRVTVWTSLDYESLAKDLSMEYARLFVGPGIHVYPYESMHGGIDGSGRARIQLKLYGEAAVAVGDFYRQAEVAPAPSFRGLPDHIGLELECMSHLTAREARCWESGSDKGAVSSLMLQRDFLGQHLVLWLPRFSRQVRTFEAHPFYRTMAAAARRFVKVDLQAVDETLEQYVARDEGTSGSGETTTSMHSSR